MTANDPIDILMIGHITKDRLVIDGHTDIATGGAVYYGGVALRHIGVRVGVVTRLHPSDFPLLDELVQEGVQVFAASAPETSSMETYFTLADVEHRIFKLKGFAGRFQAQEIPNLPTRIYLITPVVSGEVDLPLLRQLATQRPLALDAQGFVRRHNHGNVMLGDWPDMKQVLSHVTFLKVDRTEAEWLTGKTDLRTAVHLLAAYGPREIILTQSSSVIAYAGGHIYEYPFRSAALAGRTGRGDTCFATYIGKRLDDASPREACQFAAAVTTLKQERPGPWRGTLAEVEAWIANHQHSSLL